MAHLTIILLAILAFAIQQNLHSTEHLNEDIISPYIYHGRNASSGDASWQVSLRTLVLGQHLCGGTILNERWIVTSAACLTSTQYRVFLVLYNTTHVNDLENGTLAFIYKIILHEKYKNTSTDYDIALIKTEPMSLNWTNAKSISLPKQGVGLQAELILNISGWGYDGNCPPLQENLKIIQIPIIRPDLCRHRYWNITSRMFCAGHIDGGADFCHGDEGGPASNGHTLYGIPSFHRYPHKCGIKGEPGYYTNVSLFVNWIYDTMQKNINDY
ncbi:Cytochrome P450 4f11 [Blomia tropicalis]|nr:Cytochrome P450 4f11 [Blomia tropicalis]